MAIRFVLSKGHDSFKGGYFERSENSVELLKLLKKNKITCNIVTKT